MRNRPLAIVTAGCVGLLLLVLASACAPSPAETAPNIANQGPTQPAASISYKERVPFVLGVHQFNLSPYTRIPLVESQFEVSSFLRAGLDKASLVQPGTEGFWHVKVPKEETRPWVLVDMKTKQAVAVLGVLGRQDMDQMWRGYRAVLEASNDKQSWTILARLGLSSKSPKDEWTCFALPKPEPYRYYRLSTHDWRFVSMARMAMYVPAGTLAHRPASNLKPLQIQGTQQFDLFSYAKIPLESSQLEVSSFNGPWGKADLVKGGTEGFWHVEMPRQDEQEWVLMDLESERPVSLLRVRPRANFPNQMWYGYTADLEASNDEQNWTTLAVLGIPQTNLTDDWVYFLVGNLQPYRYYRLSVWDMYFFSMARLELYQFHWSPS